MPERPELHLERLLDTPVERLDAGLRAGPQRWLPGYALEGERMTGLLRYQQAGRWIERKIEAEVGPVQRFAYGATVHVQWRAARHAELYPELDGHLRLERRQPSGSRLRFDARYAPPGGHMGAAVDRALMGHVARASVADFLDRVASSLATDARG